MCFDTVSQLGYRLEVKLQTGPELGPATKEFQRAVKTPAATLLPGISSLIAATNELIKAAALNDAPVFVTGEIGTEKAFAAKLIHQLGDRSHRPMTKINVSWKLPPDMAQYFQQCSGGTLVFNLQKEFPIDMQYTLVEMAGHGCFADAMSGDVVDSDVRLILVTSLDIDQISQKTPLLPELRDILTSQHIEIPPIRNRPEDIPALVRYAVSRAKETGRSPASGVEPQVLALFRAWHWPGNAEDLLLVTAQAAIAAKSELIRIEDLPENFTKGLPPEMLEGALAKRGSKSLSQVIKKPTPEEVAGSPLEDEPEELAAPVVMQTESANDARQIAATAGAQPNTTGAAADAADHKVVSPRVLALARRLNAQSAILSRQLSGPLDPVMMQSELEKMIDQASDEQALETLEGELDRGLDQVLAMRRQMALLNVRQQQSLETIRELLQRISVQDGEPNAVTETNETIKEAGALVNRLKEMDQILNRVSSEIPQFGTHLESTLSGTLSERQPTTSGIFRKMDILEKEPPA